MSTVKAKIDSEKVLDLVRGYFGSEIPSITTIKGGEISQAFSFSVEHKDYIIRVSKKKHHFEKDSFAANHFASEKVPIPSIIDIGKLNQGLYYAISEKVQGETLESDEQMKSKLPKLIEVLEEIHKTDISKFKGYGSWNKSGQANCQSWHDYLLQVRGEEWFEWSRLFEETFMEKEVYNKLCSKLEKMDFRLEGRWLFHGDFGYDNILAQGKKISGVIDWGDSGYGDFLYDIAWLDFWSPKIDYKNIFRDYYKKEGREVPQFEERILACQIIIGLTTLGFFAKSGQKDKYDEIKEKYFPKLELD